MTPEKTVQTIDPILGRIGALHYFDPGVLAQAKEAGLDGFRMYFLGRGGVLGDVEPPVVLAAFGYFNPKLMTKMWNTAKDRMPPREASRRYLGWAAELGRDHFAELDGLADFNQAAAALIDAVDPAGLPLYAGMAAEPIPDDAPAAALLHAIVLRELRGSVHLAAIVTSGLDPVVAHAIRRPDEGPGFGWEQLPEVTEADRALLADVDERTDAIMAAHYGRLSAEQRQALVDGTLAMAAKVDAAADD
jgi:hypothetical protein